MKINLIGKLLLFATVFLGSCNVNETNGVIINTSHLDYLYDEISVDGNEMAIIHIYSNHPDYVYVDDADEGMACVDDAARAAIFYMNYFNYTGNKEFLEKNKKLLKFIMYLQADNGYFYNFIWSDYSINKGFKTSVAEPNWWSWRALWVLTESYNYYKNHDSNFAKIIKTSIDKLMVSIKANISIEKEVHIIDGVKLPQWLPAKYASDQAAVLLLGLTNYISFEDDIVIENYIKKLRDGITNMQITDKSNKYYGAFLSWETLWHAWGNNQAYALLKSYEVIEDSSVLNSALLEVDNFYDILLNKKFINSFNIYYEKELFKIKNEEEFSQIAYNLRPMIYASLEAYKITDNDKYSILAGKLAQWFYGNNPASAKMYSEIDGLVFDGINSKSELNMNSGAESTIEALLALLEISKNDIASKSLREK